MDADEQRLEALKARWRALEPDLEIEPDDPFTRPAPHRAGFLFGLQVDR